MLTRPNEAETPAAEAPAIAPQTSWTTRLREFVQRVRAGIEARIFESTETRGDTNLASPHAADQAGWAERLEKSIRARGQARQALSAQADVSTSGAVNAVDAVAREPLSAHADARTSTEAPAADADVAIAEAALEPAPGLFSRLKSRFTRRREPDILSADDVGTVGDRGVQTNAERAPAREALSDRADTHDTDEAPAAEAAPSLFSRLKKRFGPQSETENLNAEDAGMPSNAERSASREALSRQADIRATKEAPAVDAEAIMEPALESAPGLFSRIRNRLGRRREIASLDAESSDPANDAGNAPSRSRTNTSGEDATGPLVVPRRQRVRALLTNRWLWASTASVALLATIAVLAVMLVQTTHEKDQMLAALRATQPAASPVTPPVKPKPAPHPQASNAVVSFASGPPTTDYGVDGEVEDCIVTDRESVMKNLKACIERFNQATAP